MSNVANKEILKQVSMTPIVRYSAELIYLEEQASREEGNINISLTLMVIVGLIVSAVAFTMVWQIAETSVQAINSYEEQAESPTNIHGSF